MTPQTESLIRALNGAEWFSRVGNVGALDFDYASSWTEAIALCTSMDWRKHRAEAANLIGDQLQEGGAMHRYRQWNDIVLTLKAVILPMIDEKCAPVIAKHELPPAFLDAVRWDILHMCIESEYADVVVPGFFRRLADIYLAGHFPCGWRGSFPEGGRLVIY